MLHRFLLAWFAAHGDIVALIGTRIEPNNNATGGTYPRVTFSIVSDVAVGSFQGPSGLTGKRIQLDVMSRNYAEASDIAARIKGGKSGPYVNRLDGYRGEMGGVRVQGAFFVDRTDLYDEPAAGESQGVHRVAIDFEVWHEE